MITQEQAKVKGLETGVQTTPAVYINGKRFYNLRTAQNFNSDLNKLPVAEEHELNIAFGEDYETLPDHKAIMVTTNDGITCAGITSKSYKLVQHKQAFRPIVEGLIIGGVKDFSYSMHATNKYAALQLYTNEETTDGVIIGFEVKNNIDGHGSIKYAWEIGSKETVLEIVGYRYSCLNGCKFRVDLNDAHLIRPELKLKIKSLLADSKAIVHNKNAMQKIEGMQHIAEALTMIKEPITVMIEQSQNIIIAEQETELKKLIQSYVGKRYASKVKAQFEQDSDYTLWGMYNAITNVATHNEDLTTSSRELLLNKASVMLAEVK